MRNIVINTKLRQNSPSALKEKRMSIVVEYKDNVHLFIKGASELVL